MDTHTHIEQTPFKGKYYGPSKHMSHQEIIFRPPTYTDISQSSVISDIHKITEVCPKSVCMRVLSAL